LGSEDAVLVEDGGVGAVEGAIPVEQPARSITLMATLSDAVLDIEERLG
jgi:hypothetical protein